jgi:flagellar biosynthetic protein FliR
VNGLQVTLAETALAGYLLAVARMAGFVLVAPPFNTRGVPARVRVVVVIAVALPLGAVTSTTPPLASTQLMVQAVLEITTGLALGFLVQIAVAVMQAIGDLLDLVGGFSMSVAMDPLLFVQSSVMGRLHYLLGIALLFATDAHLMVLQGLFRGTRATAVPALNLGDLAGTLTERTAQMILAAVQVAGPIVVVMLVADIALGLLTRIAPALNAFSLGFPLKIVLTLMLVGFVLVRLPTVLSGTVGQAVDAMLRLTGSG